MKSLKMQVFAALAVTAFTAFAASSASATSLYNGTTKTLGVTTKLFASLQGSALLQNTEKNQTFDTCTGSTLEGEITNAGGTNKSVVGSVAKANLTWSPCTEKTETLEGGSLEINWTSGLNGEVIGKEFKVTTQNTIFNTSCVYTLGAGGTKLGTLTGSTTGNATLTISTGIPLSSGFGCPPSASWTAKYAVTSPATLHATAS